MASVAVWPKLTPIFPATAAAEDAKNGSCRAVLRLKLRGCGRFLLYSSRRPAAVQLNGQPAEALEWQEQRGALRFGVPWQQEGAAAGRGGGRHTVLISFLSSQNLKYHLVSQAHRQPGAAR